MKIVPTKLYLEVQIRYNDFELYCFAVYISLCLTCQGREDTAICGSTTIKKHMV